MRNPSGTCAIACDTSREWTFGIESGPMISTHRIRLQLHQLTFCIGFSLCSIKISWLAETFFGFKPIPHLVLKYSCESVFVFGFEQFNLHQTFNSVVASLLDDASEGVTSCWMSPCWMPPCRPAARCKRWMPWQRSSDWPCDLATHRWLRDFQSEFPFCLYNYVGLKWFEVSTVSHRYFMIFCI